MSLVRHGIFNVFVFLPPFTKSVFVIYLTLLSSLVPYAACHPFPSSMWTPLSYFFACLPSLLRKLINLQAELRACVLFFFIRWSAHMSVCLLVCLWPWPLSLCVHMCTSVSSHISVYGFAHYQVNTRPNPANDCTHVVPDSMTNNRWAVRSTKSMLHYFSQKDVLDMMVNQFHAFSPSLKKSSAELKRILSNGQVSLSFHPPDHILSHTSCWLLYWFFSDVYCRRVA